MFRRIALTGALAAACSIAGVAESSPSSTAIVYHSRIVDTYKVGKHYRYNFPNNELFATTASRLLGGIVCGTGGGEPAPAIEEAV